MTYTAASATGNGGNLQSVSVPAGPNGSTAQTVVFSYDKYDNLVSVTDALGNTQWTRWDHNGRRSSSVDPLANGSSWLYDHLHLSQMQAPSNEGSAPYARTSRLLYDPANRVTEADSQVASNGNLQMRVQYGYTGFGKLRTLTRKQSPTGSASVYQYGYDVLDRLVSWTDPLTQVTSTAYAPYCLGNTVTTARGVQRVTNMDSLCRTTQVTTQTEVRSFGYDDLSRLTSDTNGGRFGWNQAGQIVGGRLGATVSANSKTYSYDAASRTTQLTFPDGKTLSYGYDKLGNVIRMVDAFDRATDYRYTNDSKLRRSTYHDATGQPQTFVYSYQNGQLQQLAYPSSTGIAVSYGWDKGGRLLSMRYTKGSTNLQSFQYRYDNSGNRTRQVETLGTGTPLTWNYGYDWLDRLVSVTQNGVSTALYTFDNNDNRLTLVQPGSSNSFGYSYDLNDQLVNTKKNGTLFESFMFDPDGNMQTRTLTANSQATSYGWSSFNNLQQFSTNGTVGESDFYDTGGVRRIRNDGARYYNSGMTTAGEQRPTSGQISFLQGHQMLGLDEGGSVHFYVTDALGSVRQVVDASGNAQASFSTDEYGVPGASSGSAELLANTYVGAYNVRNENSAHGLYLMNQRWFDSGLGRFLNRDPIGIGGGLNLFGYADQQPTNLIDPKGLAGAAAIPIGTLSTVELDAAILAGIDIALIAAILYVLAVAASSSSSSETGGGNGGGGGGCDPIDRCKSQLIIDTAFCGACTEGPLLALCLAQAALQYAKCSKDPRLTKFVPLLGRARPSRPFSKYASFWKPSARISVPGGGEITCGSYLSRGFF